MNKAILKLRCLQPLSKCSKLSQGVVAIALRKYSLYEPDYLDSLKPQFPQYEALNFQIKGYDYPILENYQKFLHNIAEAMELEVTDSWAVPPKHIQIQRFKPLSSIVDTEYKLTLYERIVQISDVDAPLYPILLRFAEAALPEGVTLSVIEHTEDQDEIRYVPDKDLLELKAQLEEMRGPIKKK